MQETCDWPEEAETSPEYCPGDPCVHISSSVASWCNSRLSRCSALHPEPLWNWAQPHTFSGDEEVSRAEMHKSLEGCFLFSVIPRTTEPQNGSPGTKPATQREVPEVGASHKMLIQIQFSLLSTTTCDNMTTPKLLREPQRRIEKKSTEHLDHPINLSPV